MRRGQKPGWSNLRVGAVVLAVIAVATYLGFTKEIPFRHHYTISAVFKSSNNLRVNSPVRIAGVNIGKVVSVKPVGDGESAAVVKMRIDKRGLPIHKDASLAIRPRIFLEGNFFVDIQPGSPSADTIDDGFTVPINQTHTPVQLDQILTTLQAPTRKDLQNLLAELSTGLADGGGKGFNRSIQYWPSAYKNSALVNEATLGTAPHDLSGYIESATKTGEALDRDPAKLQSLITDLNTTFGAFAAQDRALSASIAELPRTLSAARPALASLNTAFPPLRKFITDIRPGVRSSTPTLKAALPFATQLRLLVRPQELQGLVKDIKPTIPSLNRVNKLSQPLFEQVRAASSCQNNVVLPWTNDKIEDPVFPATGPIYQDALKNLPGIAGESRAGDANGQWFRVLVTGGLYAYPDPAGRVMLSGNPIEGVNPPGQAERSPLRENVPCETQQPPDLRSIATNAPVAHKVSVPANKQYKLNKLRDKAVTWLRSTLKRDGLASKLKVTSKPATMAIIDKLQAIKLRELAKVKAAARK